MRQILFIIVILASITFIPQCKKQIRNKSDLQQASDTVSVVVSGEGAGQCDSVRLEKPDKTTITKTTSSSVARSIPATVDSLDYSDSVYIDEQADTDITFSPIYEDQFYDIYEDYTVEGNSYEIYYEPDYSYIYYEEDFPFYFDDYSASYDYFYYIHTDPAKPHRPFKPRPPHDKPKPPVKPLPVRDSKRPTLPTATNPQFSDEVRGSNRVVDPQKETGRTSGREESDTEKTRRPGIGTSKPVQTEVRKERDKDAEVKESISRQNKENQDREADARRQREEQERQAQERREQESRRQREEQERQAQESREQESRRQREEQERQAQERREADARRQREEQERREEESRRQREEQERQAQERREADARRQREEQERQAQERREQESRRQREEQERREADARRQREAQERQAQERREAESRRQREEQQRREAQERSSSSRR